MLKRPTGWRLLIATTDGVRVVSLGESDCLEDLGPRFAVDPERSTLSLEVVPSEAPVLLNDVQVSGTAELRGGDQLRVGEATIVVQQVTPAPANPHHKLWNRPEFGHRLREEAERARGRRGLSYLLARGKDLGRIIPALHSAARDEERLVWGSLAPDALQILVLDGPGIGIREALWSWVSSGAGGAGARAGASLNPAPEVTAEELVEQALASLGRGDDVRVQDELLMLDPISVRLRALLERFSEAALPLFLDGEPGTGKAAWAWHAHLRSGRRGGWWRLIDCRTVRDVPAVLSPIVEAGTLVLRHLEALPPHAQASLVERWPHDAGVIATSRVPLGELSRTGRLIPALAERFARGTLPLPALRDRPSEILPLALQAVQHARVTLARPRLSLGPEARAALQEYPWPENVRELRNAVGLAALAAESDEIRPENLPPDVLEHWRGSRASQAGEDLRSALKSAEKDALLKVLAQTRWNVTAAAKELGLPRRTVVYRMKRLGLRRPGR